MNINPRQVAKNLQPARSLRAPVVKPNLNTLSDFGYSPDLVVSYGPGGRSVRSDIPNGTGHQPRSSSQSRKHDVLRAPSLTHGRASTPTNGLTFNATTLSVGTLYEVNVSYVQNGPKQFMVQLRSTEHTLKQMMAALSRVPLRPMNRKLQLGMACLARFSKNFTIYRALITALRRDGTCTVSYVDYGHSETVLPSSLYEIPPEFLQYEIFSTRFALSNVRILEEINADVANIFSRVVGGKVLTLKVMPPEGAAFVSYCELYENGENIFNRLVAHCRANLYKYPVPGSLQRGGNYYVVIRFIQSCAQFFVHTIDNVAAFDKMMDDLSAHCRDSIIPGAIQVGDAFAVNLGVNDFYRAEVVEIGQKVTVRLVDYGNCITVERSQLRRISPSFVHQRPEAYECCLEGFEDATSDELSTPQLEMLSEGMDGERKTFKLVVCDVRDGKTIVNLFDESETPVLNVSKKLLKLKNPAKFIKDQQNSQQKAQSKQPGGGQKATEIILPQPQLPQVGGGWVPNKQQEQATNQKQQLLGTSTDSGKGIGILSSSGVSSSHADYIDLTNDEWSGGPPLPGHQSSGYEQQQQTGGGADLHASPPRNNRSGNSSRDSSSSNNNKQDNKRNPFVTPAGNGAARYDIPRFNKERNPTPYYYEHDDRFSDGISPPANFANERNNRAEVRSFGNPSDFYPPPVPTTENFKPTASSNTQPATDDYVPYRSSFPEQIVPMNTKLEVVLSWWFSPEQFFVRLRSDEDKYHEMMKQLQKFYRNKSNQQQHQQQQQAAIAGGGKAQKPSAGSIVVVRHPKHNAFYRGRVVKYNESVQKYKVELVDAGNKLVLSSNDLWMVERRFTRLAPMAISCALPEIRLLCEVKELQNRIDAYIGNEKQIEATFLERTAEGKHHCKVETQGSDLKTQLIADSLIVQVLVDIDLARLKGQTLKVQLIELKGLSNFRVKVLGHSATFSCRLDDCDGLADSAEVLAELRNKWLDRYCSAQVVDVTSDEKLVLSLLIPSLTGQPQPTIAEMPVLVSKFNVYVTQVEGMNSLYVQNVRWTDEIAQLMDDLFDYYEQRQQGVPLANLTMHEMCVSKSPSDSSWYRAKIVSLQELDKIEVLLVDYGHREQVKHSELKQLEPQFLEYSAFAHKVHLPMGAIAGVEEERIANEITQLTEGHELTLSVLDFRNSIWIVDITSNDYSIVSVLKDKQLVADLDYEMIFNQRQASTPVPGAVVRPSVEDHEAKHQKIRAKICHVDNPSQLFIQLESDLKDLHQLQENLQIIASSLPPLRDFSADRHCIAQYSADDLWYRALIIDSHDDLIIQFVDFGHTDIVTSNKKSTLRDINDDLMKWKIYAKQCAMLVQPTSPEPSGSAVGTGGQGSRRKKPAAWKEVATTILRALDEVEVQFLAEAQGVHYISLRSGEKDIAEMLVEKKLAVRLLYVPSDQRCFTSHIESINEFYIQLERDVFPLDTMANYLNDVSKFADLTEPQPGVICIAQYLDDGLWYRAKVLAVRKPGEYEVFFLDYGNTSIVHQLKELDASIAELARLCAKCALRLPENVRSWSKEAEEKFLELSAMGETVFTVQLYSPGPAFATVELFHEGRNIAEQLVALCEKGTGASAMAYDMNSSFYLSGDENRLDDSYQLEDDKVYVSHVNSPAEFFIQFKNNFDALRNMEELLAAKAGRCEVIREGEIRNGMLCLAQLALSGKFCRALVLSEVHGGHATYHSVLLIDYGNRAAATELRRMPAAIEEMSRLAKKCCLEHFLPMDEHTLGAKRWGRIRGRFTQLADTGREVFSVEIVRNDCDPMIIRLFTPTGENVEDLIRSDAMVEEEEVSMESSINNSSTANFSGSTSDAQIRAKPKQAFYRANSDLEFLEN
ncbi:maternal protein tudor [Anopheles ziemanni]|uniref:maternal protein tudor n=1 Tax=Anopheles coustani TaxID=139045 RepID=UPI00265A2B39|nr:maternal protein tudor [Anopheles coustani]XP_058119703.1 maternal protein tudor [Anopheles coustani]XP_058177527.1 maternal protein tudor [Anopheles ziemanni]